MNPLELMSQLYQEQLAIYQNADQAAVATALIINQMLDSQRDPVLNETPVSDSAERLAA